MFFSRHHRTTMVLFSLMDAILTVLAFELAYRTRLHLTSLRLFYFLPPEKALLVSFCAIAWVAVGYWLGIYRKLDFDRPSVIVVDSLRQTAGGVIALLILEYLLYLNVSRSFVTLFAVYNWLALLLFRLQAPRLAGLISKEFGEGYFVLVVGVGDRALQFAHQLEETAGSRIRLRGFLADETDPPRSIRLRRAYPVYTRGQMRSTLREEVVDEVLFAVDADQLSQMEDLFLLCEAEGVRTRIVLDFLPQASHRMRLEFFGPTPLLTFTGAPDDQLKLLVKRCTDLVLAAAALVITAPVMLIAAIAIRLTSPGPLIFRQERCGLNGRRFVCLKFRSMVADAEARMDEVAHMSQRITAIKIPHDPRLTPIGGLLRKFSIDELPQLINVIRGDMSLVGPRPAVPSEVEAYQQWQRRRLRMRPGLTCLWAINGRDLVDFDTWMKMDLQYIDNWSLALDWKLILKTIPAVVLGKGAS
jgi:exopolysaccharide biosynthesis polyprenyl glycosylphosphotransferase